jgi:DNA-binding transcriptional LysR family regulator
MRHFADTAEVLVASPAYLERNGTPASPAELARHPTLSFQTQTDRHVWTLSGPGNETVQIEHTPRLICHNFPVLHTAAVAGQGIALLPETVACAALAAGTLVRVLPDWHLPQGVFHVVFPHRRGLLPAVRAFIDFLAETMPAAAAAVSSCPPGGASPIAEQAPRS